MSKKRVFTFIAALIGVANFELCTFNFALGNLYAQKEARITLSLKGMQNGDSITLSWGTFNKPLSPLILQVAAQEEQVLRIPLNEPRLIIIGLKDYSGGYELIASPNEDIHISGRIHKEKNGKHPSVNFPKVSVSGATWQLPYQSAVAEYLYHLDSLTSTVSTDFRDVQKLIRRAKEEKNEQTIADMYQTIVGRSYIDRVTGNFYNMGNYFQSLVMSHKNNFLAPLLILRFGGNIDKKYRSLYDAMGEEARQSYYGREVKDAVYPPSMLGTTAPTVAVMTRDKTEKLLSFTHQTNRYLLLDFWASWCEPCLNEVPNLKRIYQKYHSKGLDIIGLSVDKNYDDWIETLDEMEEPWCNYIDIDKQAIMEYQVQYIPSIFIMDAQGKIIAEKLRGNDLSDFIDELFEKK